MWRSWIHKLAPKNWSSWCFYSLVNLTLRAHWSPHLLQQLLLAISSFQKSLEASGVFWEANGDMGSSCGSPLQLAGYVITVHACVQCDCTSPGLKGPLQGGLILPVWEGRIILPRSGQHTCQSTNVYKWFFFPQLYLSLGFFSLTSRKYPCCALLFFPCRVTPHLTTSNSLYSCLDLAASALLNFYINDITEELIFVDFKIL